MLRQPPFFVEVDLVECGVNIVISMPASCSTDFIHLARVSLEAGLYDFDVVMKKQVMLPLSNLVRSMYCLNSNHRLEVLFLPHRT